MAQEAAVIERRTIDFVPESERHGKVFSMFTLFFSGNMQITAVAIGVIPIELGLSLWWSVFALVLGNVLGGFVMAAHAVQGPRIGIPQMIQSRAQFGVLGANIPLAFVVLMYLGFFSGSAILGGSAVALLLGVSKPVGILLANVLTYLLLALGYDTIHRYAKWAASVFAAIFIVATILAFDKLAAMPTGPAVAASVSLPMLLVAISIFATWQITYGPYVADYSRYMPQTTSARAIFWNTYLGSVIGSSWAMLLGVALGLLNQKLASADPTAAFSGLFAGPVAWLSGPVLLIVLAGVVVVNALNLYGGSLSTLTILSSRAGLRQSTLQHGKWWRIGLGATGAVIGSLIAILGADSVMAYLNNLLLILMYVFVPWSAINLTDFFLLRHGEYSIPDIYNRQGRYGAWGWPALIAFAVAILVEVPFMSMPFFTGPIAGRLGGADVTWVVGLIVASVLYALLVRGSSRSTASR
jgi:NCS1 family nucleobase:cation symporter-1